MGRWLTKYGESIYHTRGGYIRPQKWGCLTERGGTLYVHVLSADAGTIRLEKFPYSSIGKARLLNTGAPVAVNVTSDGAAELQAPSPTAEEPDMIIAIEVKN
jgi:alpha-L-fucosidase